MVRGGDGTLHCKAWTLRKKRKRKMHRIVVTFRSVNSVIPPLKLLFTLHPAYEAAKPVAIRGRENRKRKTKRVKR